MQGFSAEAIFFVLTFKNNAYIFNIVVTDSLGATYNKEYVLNKGVFPLFIDTALNSVGINCFPKEANSLEVNELNVYKVATDYVRNFKNKEKDKNNSVMLTG